MISGLKVVVVLPAYRAERTLSACYEAIPFGVVDEVLLVDDASDDATVREARRLGIPTHVHPTNQGYGANQKTCYRQALDRGADIVVMLHPDYQYEPRLITAMAGMVASGVYDIVLGSRLLGNTALAGGMPLYKWLANQVLTFIQNRLMGIRLSEYHTGYRAFSRRVLDSLPLLANSDDFLFDNQVLTQAAAFDFRIGEVSCPTKYFPEASSIDLYRSVIYGLGVIGNSVQYRLWRMGLSHPKLFTRDPKATLTELSQQLPESGRERVDE